MRCFFYSCNIISGSLLCLADCRLLGTNCESPGKRGNSETWVLPQFEETLRDGYQDLAQSAEEKMGAVFQAALRLIQK